VYCGRCRRRFFGRRRTAVFVALAAGLLPLWLFVALLLLLLRLLLLLLL
jgi:hypothetical protein